MVLEKTLESPLDFKEIQTVHHKVNQSWIFIERTDAKATGPILWHLMQRANSLYKTLMLGKIEAGGEGDDREWDGWMASPTQWRWVWASSGRRWKTGKPGVLYVVHGVAMNQTRLNDWATTFNFAISSLGCPPFLTWSLVQPPTWTLCLHPLPPYSILYLAVRGMVLKL